MRRAIGVLNLAVVIVAAAGATATTSARPVVTALPRLPLVGLVEPVGPGPTVWHDSFAGWTVTTRRSVALPRAGQLVHFDVTAVPPRPGADSIMMFWGDGMTTNEPQPSPDCQTGWGVPAGHPVTIGFDHAWRLAGRDQLTIEPNAGCSSGRAPAYPHHWLDVSPGRLLDNGPQRPTGRVDYGAQDSGQAGVTDYFWAEGDDPDGYVAELIFNWGDGSSPTVERYLDHCHRPPDPRAWIESSNFVDNEPHHYPGDPAQYVIALTVVSSGCHGEDPQRTTIRWQPTRVEPTPNPTPSPAHRRPASAG